MFTNQHYLCSHIGPRNINFRVCKFKYKKSLNQELIYENKYQPKAFSGKTTKESTDVSFYF